MCDSSWKPSSVIPKKEVFTTRVYSTGYDTAADLLGAEALYRPLGSGRPDMSAVSAYVLFLIMAGSKYIFGEMFPVS